MNVNVPESPKCRENPEHAQAFASRFSRIAHCFIHWHVAFLAVFEAQSSRKRLSGFRKIVQSHVLDYSLYLYIKSDVTLEK
jgi:hypothetical protein